MKLREIILWVLVIILILFEIHDLYWINQNYNLIKTMSETQSYILELIDLRLGWWLM